MTFSLAIRRDTENKDFAIGADGRLALAVGTDAALDRIDTKLNTQTGDWFLDVTHGIDYKDKVFVPGADKDEVSALIRRGTLEVYAVESIESFSMSQDPDNRRSFIVSSRVFINENGGTTESITTVV